MSDKIDTVINPRTELRAWEWLVQFAIHPGLRAQQRNQDRKVDAVNLPLLGEDSSEAQAPVAAIVSSPKPQIASQTWRAIFAGSFRKTFIGDGYNPSENSVVTFDRADANRAKGQEAFTGGQEIRYQVEPLSADLEVSAPARRTLDGVNKKGVEHVGHAIASFLGVPNRFHQLGTDGQLVFNGWTILRNYTGMKRPLFEKAKSDSDYTLRIPGLGKYKYVGGEYGIWQTLALPIKLGIGLPLKLALTVVNFAVNIVKLATEFLPSVIVNGSAKLIRSLADTFGDTWKPVTRAQKDRGLPKRLAIYFATSIAIAALGAVHYVGRVALLLGTAFTSPAKLARDAWDFAHQLTIKKSDGETNEKVTAVFRKVIGVFAILLSTALTVALWAVALPFGIAALVKYVPQFMVAVNWVLATPFIAPALAYVNGALTVVGGYLSVFLPLANALAVSAGLQMTAAVLAVGVSIGSIAAVVANIATPIVNAIGNWAALRKSNSGPYSYLAALRSKKGGSDTLPSTPLDVDPNQQNDDLENRPEEEDSAEQEKVSAADAGVRLLIAQGMNESNNQTQTELFTQALRLAAAHDLREAYFEYNQATKVWNFKRGVHVPAPLANVTESDIALTLVRDLESAKDQVEHATLTAEKNAAKGFVELERKYNAEKGNHQVADELGQLLEQIEQIQPTK